MFEAFLEHSWTHTEPQDHWTNVRIKKKMKVRSETKKPCCCLGCSPFRTLNSPCAFPLPRPSFSPALLCSDDLLPRPPPAPSPLYLCLVCPGRHGDILGAAVLISAFNNEWKDTIRQSLQNHVAHNAQGQDGGSCQRGWWLAQTGVWRVPGHMHHTYAQKTAPALLVKDVRT